MLSSIDITIQNQAMILAHETEIAARYRVSRRVVYNTIDQWNNHYTVESLPRPRPPEKVT